MAQIMSERAVQQSFNTKSLVPDERGVYTVVEWRRKQDNTLYAKSTLSNQVGADYTKCTVQFYDKAGTAVVFTEVWTLTYDSQGKIISKVVS